MDLRDPFREQDGQIMIDLPGARAVFTTRSWGDVRETQEQIGERLGVKLVRTKQVHGDCVIGVITPPDEANPLELDGRLRCHDNSGTRSDGRSPRTACRS